MILSLFFQFILNRETIDIDEAQECQLMLDAFQLSIVPSVSIRSKAITTVLKKKAVLKSAITIKELTSNELEYVAEILFEMAACKSQRHLSFSSAEILQIYQEVIVSNLTVMEVFEAFNVLDENDFKELQLLAGLQDSQLETNEKEMFSRGKKKRSIFTCVKWEHYERKI